jgi:hypothetical protein
MILFNILVNLGLGNILLLNLSLIYLENNNNCKNFDIYSTYISRMGKIKQELEKYSKLYCRFDLETVYYFYTLRFD